MAQGRVMRARELRRQRRGGGADELLEEDREGIGTAEVDVTSEGLFYGLTGRLLWRRAADAPMRETDRVEGTFCGVRLWQSHEEDAHGRCRCAEADCGRSRGGANVCDGA